MRVRASQLIKLNVRYTVHENELYFAIADIKKLLIHKKFPPDKIKNMFIGGVSMNVIRAQDIEDMNEFDKNVVEFMKYNPNQHK